LVHAVICVVVVVVVADAVASKVTNAAHSHITVILVKIIFKNMS
jgi:hypothetical protein